MSSLRYALFLIIYLSPCLAGMVFSAELKTELVSIFSNDIDSGEFTIDSSTKSGQYRQLYSGSLLVSGIEKNLTKEVGIASSDSETADGNINSTTTFRDGTVVVKNIEEIAAFSFKFTYIITTSPAFKGVPGESSYIEMIFGAGMEKSSESGAGFFSDIQPKYTKFVSFDNTIQTRRAGDDEGWEVQLMANWIGLVKDNLVLTLKTANSIPLRLASKATDENTSGIHIIESSRSGSLSSNESVQFEYIIYVDTKEGKPSAGLPEEFSALKFSNVWSGLKWICIGLQELFRILFSLIGSWGISIMALCICIRIAIIPITRLSKHYQSKAVKQAKKIGPKMDLLKKTYSGVELSEKIISLYKETEYDHLAALKSMAGLFIQIPIFYAVYNVMIETAELSGASFFWIENLAASDRIMSIGLEIPFFGSYFNLLPMLMLIVSCFTVYMSDRTYFDGGKISWGLYLMNFVFFILFYTFSSALVLYWLTANVFAAIESIKNSHVKPSP